MKNKEESTKRVSFQPISSRKPKTTENPRKNRINPFFLPNTEEIYSQHEEIAQKRKDDVKKIKMMPLSERALLPTGVTSHRSMKQKFENKIKNNSDSVVDSIMPLSEKYQRQTNTSNIIEEQREIFLSNLLISRHQKELERLAYIKSTQEAKLENMEFESNEAQNRSKTIQNQYDKIRSREKLNLEELNKKRQNIEVQTKKKRIEIASLKNEIRQYEEAYSIYKAYDSFLNEIKHIYGRRPESSSELLDFFDAMERENLFLLQNAHQIQNQSESSQTGVYEELKLCKGENSKLETEIAHLQLQRDELMKSDHFSIPKSDQLDESLDILQKSISKIYLKCFPDADPSQKPLTMLSIIENNLETMMKKLDTITNKADIAQKVKVLYDKRRQELRAANQNKILKEQEEKKNQMIERATKPVKKRTGRPLYERVILAQYKKRDAIKYEAEQIEKDRLEKLLFGESIFE